MAGYIRIFALEMPPFILKRSNKILMGLFSIVQTIRDSAGKTPLDLCAPVPKPDWQGVAFLLQQSCQLRPTKMEVQLVGGSALQVEVEDIETATAGELREKVLALEGLEPIGLGQEIFAIWLVESRLSEF
jgi:hypothetical protein